MLLIPSPVSFNFERERSYWIGSYLNLLFARPVVKKSTFLQLQGSFEYEIQTWKHIILPIFLSIKVFNFGSYFHHIECDVSL